MTIDDILEVQREISAWVRALTGEGHATIQQARRRLSAEQAVVRQAGVPLDRLGRRRDREQRGHAAAVTSGIA